MAARLVGLCGRSSLFVACKLLSFLSSLLLGGTLGALGLGPHAVGIPSTYVGPALGFRHAQAAARVYMYC